ncbi:MAG: hypothetical protein K6F39_01460 [Lachnospiraceae bacterium]|nr:hypothetical protein [Lachnospiraceae bacterium]
MDKSVNKASQASVALGVGFVWFTSQFGGGFASGTQLYQYFINFGIWCLITPAIAQLFQAFFQWYALKFAFEHKTSNYRDFTDQFYGRFKIIFSNLYEVVYFMLILLAPSIAFATGGATLHELTGIPYMLCTAIVGVFIFGISMMNTDMIRKAATIVSYVLIIGILLVFIPNIIAQWDSITASISALSAGQLPVGSTESGTFGSALWFSLLYGAYHVASIGLYVQHAQKFTDKKQCATSMIYGFFINTIVITVVTLGLMAVALNPELPNYSVYTLLFAQEGVLPSALAPVVSLLIIIGSVFSGVNMIVGFVNRVVTGLEKKEEPEVSAKKRTMRTVVTALVCTLVTFSISQFGLLPLVKKGYSYLGFACIVVIVIPFVIHMIASAFGKKRETVNV